MIKGLSEMLGNGGVDYLKLEDGGSAVIRILLPADELIGVYEHTEQFASGWKTVTCLGKNTCPLCKAGKRANFKAYIPVLDRSDDKVKIFKVSKTVVKQLVGMMEEYGDLTSRDYKVLRTGKKLDTTYQFFPKDNKEIDLSQYEIPDIESIVEPMTPEAIRELMIGDVDEGDSPVASNSEDVEYPF